MILPGFPLNVGGTERYRSRRGRENLAADLEEQATVTDLAQRCEEALRSKLRHGSGSPAELAEMITEVALSPDLRPYLERIHSVRLVSDILEVEFSAVGFGYRYASYIGVDGTGGRHKIRKLERTTPVASSSCSWVESEHGSRCVAVALDPQGETIARVTVCIEQRRRGSLLPYREGEGNGAIEESTMRIARIAGRRQA